MTQNNGMTLDKPNTTKTAYADAGSTYKMQENGVSIGTAEWVQEIQKRQHPLIPDQGVYSYN